MLREKGQLVKGLMRTWRQLRQKFPKLFKLGVRVWGQREMTMDEMICGLLTQTDREDLERRGHSQSVLQVDLFGGEHTEYSLDQKWLANQPQNTIGQKQTAKLQLTDIRFAKLAKVRQERHKPKIRTKLRRAAGRLGKAAQMCLKGRLKLEMACEMHAACVEDNENNQGVLTAARSSGYLAFRPTKEGLLPLDGPVWEKFPLGSSRLAARLNEMRKRGVPRKPSPPDWSQLKEVRDKQNKAAV